MTTSDEDTPPEVREAALKAGLWIEGFAKANSIDLAALSPAQWVALSMKVPCPIRCWRVGVGVLLTPGEVCPECGQKYELSLWERLAGEDEIG